MRGFRKVTALRGIEIEREMRLISATFDGLLLLPFVLHQVLQAGEQPRTEPARPRFRALEDPLGYHPAGEEFLGQILGLSRRVATPPKVGVERVPIGHAELSERSLRLRRIRPRRREYD